MGLNDLENLFCIYVDWPNFGQHIYTAGWKNERIREIYRVKFWRPFGFSRKYKKRPAISWLTSKGPVLESEHYATHCFFFIADYPTIKSLR